MEGSGSHLAVKSWRSLVLVLFICLTVRHSSGKSIAEHMFWSDVHLEHYYIIEENVLSHADILLRDGYFGKDEFESEEEHKHHSIDLTPVQKIVNETKAIHTEAGPQLQDYLSNPINVYHLIHRLSTQWKKTLDLMLDTKPCKEWGVRAMIQRLKYLRKKLPGDREIELVILFTSMLQRIHGVDASDLSQGKIGDNIQSTRPLSLDEQIRFSNVLRDTDDHVAAISWYKAINNQLKEDKSQDSNVNRSSILTKLATTFFTLKNYEAATKVSEEAYKLNPKSVSAKRTMDYFKSKLESGDHKPKGVKKYKSRFEKVCAKPRLSKSAKQSCFYTRMAGLHFVKTEVIRSKPAIYLFHDIVSEKHADKLQDYAFKTQTEKAWVGDERYVIPDFRTSLHPNKLVHASKYVKEAAQKWIEALAMLTKGAVEIDQLRWGAPSVVNLGLDGMHLNQHDRDLGIVKPLFGKTSVFYTFLSGARTGGHAVFDKWGITAQPAKGSVLFYSTSKTPAHSHCPVIGRSIWMLVQPIYESPKNYCDEDDEWK